ncbi:ATP-binding cassette domain-containing protein [Symbioplanes lichenis]|uniref:ATP-binding cassette domain-containing protein n=1 Tax=Symbioplanes lichenis TaxID=1629072 RepID=UPI002739AF23|nr:ATP-binding cassette domain-containing protein [Actinoplanes lichenis]
MENAPTTTEPLLEAEGLRKSFGPRPVVDDVSLSVDAGQVLAVVGGGGAGKSTLLDLLSGAAAPDTGTVWLDGEDVTRLGVDERRRRGVGRTRQVPRPLAGVTVFESVLAAAAGLRGHRAQAAAAGALERAGIRRCAGEPAGRLPPLDRRRLELARALAAGPRVLLLDGIAGGLTGAEGRILLNTVSRLRSDGLAVVWAGRTAPAAADAWLSLGGAGGPGDGPRSAPAPDEGGLPGR